MFGILSRRFLKVNPKIYLRYSTFINSDTNRTSNNSNIVHSWFPEIKFCNSTIPEYVFQDFGKYPNKIAMECCVTGKKYTFEEVRRKSANFAKALRKKLKLRKGDIIALMLPNIPDFAICILGSLEAAITVTTINPLYTPDEVKGQLIDSNAKLLITLGQLWPVAQNAIKLLPESVIKPAVMTVKMMESETLPSGAINFQEFVDTTCDIDINEKHNANDLTIMPYSSGTVGKAKGVELTTNNILSCMQQMQEPIIKLSYPTTEMHQDVVPAVIPWFHIYGMVGVLFSNLYSLTKMITMPKFAPEVYIQLLDKHRPHLLYIVPPLVLLMINSPLIVSKHLEQLRSVCCGAAPLGALDEEKLQNKVGPHINVLQGYGLTESSCLALMMPYGTKKKLGITGSVGTPIANTSIKIISVDKPSNEALGPNENGELLIKGPQITPRYHNRPQETEKAFVDGWFCTGDIAYYDENKIFFITDRLKDLIKVKGFQVPPAELEEIIRDFPGVSDAAVIGIPHETYGELPRAYIVPKPNSKIDVEKLQEYVASKVTSFKQLKGGVSIIDSIPKTASGKTLKRELRVLYENEKQK